MELPVISVLNEEKVSEAEQIYHNIRCAYNKVYFELFAEMDDSFESKCPDFDSLINNPVDFLLNSMTVISDSLLQVLFDYEIYSVDVNAIVTYLLTEKSSRSVLNDLSDSISKAVNIVQNAENINQPSNSYRANVQWNFAGWFEEGYENGGMNGAKSNITSNMIKSFGLSAINAAVESNENKKLRKRINETKERAYDKYFDTIKEATLHAIANMSKLILFYAYAYISKKFDCDEQCSSIMKRYNDIKFDSGLYYIEDSVNTTIFRNVNNMYAQGKLSAEKAAEQIGKIIIDNPYANPRYYTRLMQLCPENADSILSTAERYGMNALACCNSMFLLMLEPSCKDTAATFDVNINLLREAIRLTDLSSYRQVMNKLINENQTAKEYCQFCGVNTLEETAAYSSELNDIEKYLEKAKNKMSERRAQDKLSLFISENFSDIDFNDFSKKNYEKIQQAKRKLEKFSDVESKEKQELFRKVKKFYSEYKQHRMSEFIDQNLAGVDFGVYTEENYEKIFNAYEILKSDFPDSDSNIKNELLSKIEKYFCEYDIYQFDNKYYTEVIEKINFNDYSAGNYHKIKDENEVILNKYRNVQSDKKAEALKLFEEYYQRYEQNRLVNLKIEYEEFVRKNLNDGAFIERTEYQKKFVSEKLEIIKTDYAEVVSEDLINRCDEYIKNAETTSDIICSVIGYIIVFVILYLLIAGLGGLLSKIPLIGIILKILTFGLKIICILCGIAVVWDKLSKITKKY
ncbi:MAG: hypothetical protein MSJ26_11890 [Oscillospiraceae bacterium]|nr:hypothetical protein [Oscillospiraceae bacterium]